MTNWTPENLRLLDQLLQTETPHKTAVFDADGTIWHDDLGEAFFKYQIKNQLAPGIKNISDPWQYYVDMDRNKGTAVASGWLAQISAGLLEETLQKQCYDFYFSEFSQKIRTPVADLIKKMSQMGFEVWICTASPKWSIEPSLKDLNIPLNRLIGTEVKLTRKKVLTKELIEPVPYMWGKKVWLEKKLPEAPLFVAGNSSGDLEMMTLAQKMALAVVFLPHRTEVETSEKVLLDEAARRKWPVQTFLMAGKDLGRSPNNS